MEGSDPEAHSPTISGLTSRSGQNVSFVDFDQDGFLDVFLGGEREIRNREGQVQFRTDNGRLFHNLGNDHHYLRVELVGSDSNSSTMIRFALPQSQKVDLSVYNLAGQQVVTLVQGTRQAGSYRINWDGRDDQGRALASGVYFYRIKAGTQVQTRKLLLLR